jgi:hypothetical protein
MTATSVAQCQKRCRRVGSVHDLEPGRACRPGKAGAAGTGAVDPDDADSAEGRQKRQGVVIMTPVSGQSLAQIALSYRRAVLTGVASDTSGGGAPVDQPHNHSGKVRSLTIVDVAVEGRTAVGFGGLSAWPDAGVCAAVVGPLVRCFELLSNSEACDSPSLRPPCWGGR